MSETAQADPVVVGLVQIFDGLHKAGMEYMQKCSEINARNEAIRSELPPEPGRGSFLWWASICRENTGQAICDSGTIYGYNYNRPIPPEQSPDRWIELYKGKVDYGSMSLVHFLHEAYQADDPIAIALEQVLYWIGSWLYPREHWGSVIAEFVPVCLDLSAYTKDGEHIDLELVAKYITARYDNTNYYDLTRSQQGMTSEQFVSEAMLEFPSESFDLLLSESFDWESANERGGFNTYNGECDLNQVYQCDLVFGDSCYPSYAILRTHNGCDVRGGYSSPVVVAIDPFADRSAYDWLLRPYCTRCSESWDMIYYYNQDIEKADPSLPVAEWKADLALLRQVEQGQGVLPLCSAPSWNHYVDREVAERLIAFYNAQIAEGELEKGDPFFVQCLTQEGHVPEVDTVAYPLLYCPSCNGYTVII